MAHSVQAVHSIAVEIDVISIIVKSKMIKLPGSWRLGKVVGETRYNNNGANVMDYDYLVNIHDVNNVIHPEDIRRIKSIIADLRSGINSEYEFRFITPSGEIKQLRGEVDLASAIVYSFDDIPNRKKADEEIIASKNLLEAVFNTSTLGLHVLQSIRNDEGIIVDFNILLTNATSDKIAGRKVSGLRMLEGWPHTKEIGLFDKFVHTVETGHPLNYEHLYEGDGVRAWFQWIASRLNDGLYVTIEDITERKNAEESLKQTADRLQSTFDGVPAIIALLEVVADKLQPVDFVISAANKALSDFTGCKTSDLIGKKMTDLYPEAFRGKLQDSYLQVFTTGEPLYLEFLYPGLDRWFSIFVTKQVDAKGIVAVGLEITAQKKGEEQRKQNQLLAELDKAKTEFFSNVSHEFRTPLTLMLGPVNDVLKKLEGNPVYSEELSKLQMIQRNGLRLHKLVNALLDFSRIEAGRADAIFQPTDIAEYTTLLAGNFRSAIEHAGLKLVVNCESTEPIYVNQDMWEKIVLNLLSNAFKFTFSGEIEVSLRSYKKQVQLHVRDTGIGISPSDISKIFERFMRVPNARSRTYEGTGIGLALVKELVNIHGGNIKVKSKDGKGTVFVVSIFKGKAHLPLKNIYELKEKRAVSPLSSIFAHEAMNWLPARSEELEEKKYGTHSGDGISSDSFILTRKEVVLLVDDNSDIREYIKSILNHNYEVATANNGRQALELIKRGLKPDLVLADLMMPELDGYSLLKEIRNNEQTAGVPFILLSSSASEEARVEGIRSGADDYLVKPFSSVELLARIDSRIQIAAFQKRQQRD